MPKTNTLLTLFSALAVTAGLAACSRSGEAPASRPAEPAQGTAGQTQDAPATTPSTEVPGAAGTPTASVPPAATSGGAAPAEPPAPASIASRPVPEREADGKGVPATPRPEPRREPTAKDKPAPPAPVTKTVPAGTPMDVRFTEPLSSESATAGDAFTVTVVHDVTHDGVVVIPAGSKVSGTVTEAVGLKKIGGRAKLTLAFDTLHVGEDRVAMSASIAQEGKNETGRDAATIGGAAAGGAILGRVLSKGDRNKGTIIGAVVGAAAGTAIAANTKGEEVTIPAGTEMGITLDRPIDVSVRR